MKDVIKLSTLSFIPLSYFNYENMNQLKPAIQLFGLRNELKQSLWDTLKTIAKIGYREIELYMDESTKLFFGYPADVFFKRVSDMGLKVVGQHILSGKFGTKTDYSLTVGFEPLVEVLAKYNVSYLTHAWLFPQERENIKDFYDLAELLNKCGEYCKSAGVKIMYHNHDFEFVNLDGEIPFDVLLSQTNSGYVNFEIDFYWMYVAGINPLDYLQKYPNRFELWHFKDMKKDSVDFTELGKGRINYDEIMKYVNSTSVKHIVIDQDEFYIPWQDALSINFNRLDELINNIK